jgi:hypothetical protein
MNDQMAVINQRRNIKAGDADEAVFWIDEGASGAEARETRGVEWDGHTFGHTGRPEGLGDGVILLRTGAEIIQGACALRILVGPVGFEPTTNGL